MLILLGCWWCCSCCRCNIIAGAGACILFGCFFIGCQFKVQSCLWAVGNFCLSLDAGLSEGMCTKNNEWHQAIYIWYACPNPSAWLPEVMNMCMRRKCMRFNCMCMCMCMCNNQPKMFTFDVFDCCFQPPRKMYHAIKVRMQMCIHWTSNTHYLNHLTSLSRTRKNWTLLQC